MGERSDALGESGGCSILIAKIEAPERSEKKDQESQAPRIPCDLVPDYLHYYCVCTLVLAVLVAAAAAWARPRAFASAMNVASVALLMVSEAMTAL